MRTYVNLFLRVVTVMTVSAAMFAACDPNMEPEEEFVDPEELNELKEQNDSLANVLQRQLRAMTMLLSEESLYLSYCNATETDGLYEMSFEGGMSFVAFPDKDGVFSVVSYVDDNGSGYWTVLDKEGKSSVLTNAAGNKISTDSVLEVEVTSEGYVFNHNGESFKTDYARDDTVQAFGVSLVVDAEDVVYAVRFDFGGGKTRTVYVSSYSGSKFYLLEDEGKSPVSELCVDWNTTASLGVYIPAGVEYEFVCPEGWTVAFQESPSAISITAPEYSEQAKSQGVIKAVSTDGIFTFAEVNVTTDPFRTILASATKVVVVPSMGIDKFAYGISLKSDFSADAVLNNAVKWIAGEESPAAGCAVAEAAVSKTFVEVLGNELDAAAEYVLWAVGNGHLISVDFVKVKVEIEPVKTYLLDADIKVTVEGADAVFGGVIEKTEDVFTDILFQLENSILDSIPVSGDSFVYDGLMTDYPVVDNYKNEIMPATTYIVWAASAVTGYYEYSAGDVFYKEISTNGLVAGGEKTVSFGTAQTTASTIEVAVSSESAAMIYYAVLNNSTGKRYAADDVPNDEKFKQLMANSPVAEIGNSVVAKPSKLEPSSTYWVYAVAVDENGNYGPVSCVSAKTQTLVFDESIKLSIESLQITSQKIVLKVTSAGGDLSDYVYWAGRKTEPFWANYVYCAGNKQTAEKYMALNPEDENIVKAMKSYGSLADDGTITLDGLNMETEYVFVILEKGQTAYSRIGYVMVKTLAADLGNIVKEGTEEWNKAKASVKLDWNKNKFEPAANSAMMATYGFTFSCPDNLTAYVMCASDSYFSEAGITKTEHIMIEIENYASRRYANGVTPSINGEFATEPDYSKDGEVKKGQLMNVYDFYVHGLPSLGFVTYFAKDSHKEGNCIYWENGACQQYKTYEESIAKFNSLTPWEERAAQFGLTGKEASDWAQALLEAYSVYYKDAKPVVYENDGKGVGITNPYATGVNEEGVIPDRVVVMFKDLQGNYYEPMFFEVPNYFE